MKTISTDITNYALLLFFAVIVSTPAAAGALIADPAEKIPTPKKHTEPMGTAVGGTGNTTPIARDTPTSQRISCWQNGELIFEQPVLAPKDKVVDIRLLHNPIKNADMIALDFKNAFCFIK